MCRIPVDKVMKLTVLKLKVQECINKCECQVTHCTALNATGKNILDKDF